MRIGCRFLGRPVRFGVHALLVCALSATLGASTSPAPEAILREKILIPAGEFTLGRNSTAVSENSPARTVFLDGFEISRFEVTWEEFQAFIDAGGYKDRATNGYWSRKGLQLGDIATWSVNGVGGQKLDGPHWSPTGAGPPEMVRQNRWPPRLKDPVVGISYWEAEAYASFVGGRLPTEAEWEKAAKWDAGRGEARTFPWGESASTPLPANGYEASEGYSVISEVDNPKYAGDISVFGVRGLGGNVREWVADMYDPDAYARASSNNPFNYQSRRTDHTDAIGALLPIEWCLRGGHFMSVTSDRKPFECSTRVKENPFYRSAVVGFRVAWDLGPPKVQEPVERSDRPGTAVVIPGGTYQVGHTLGMPSDSGSSANESPQHDVCLDPFWIGKYEVTWYEYKKYMAMGGYGDPLGPRPSWWSEDGWRWRINPPGAFGNVNLSVKSPDLLGRLRPTFGRRAVPWKGPWSSSGSLSSPPDDHPVVSLSWYEAEAYCKFVGGRLPLEVEWEVAATWNPATGKPLQFPWGNLYTFSRETLFTNGADDPKYPGYQSSPVGMYPEGRSPFGCEDMAGNAFEWVEDWYNPASYATHESQCGGNITTPAALKIPAPVLLGYSPIPGFRSKRGGSFDPEFDGAFSQRGRTRGIDGAQGFRHHTFGVRVAWDRDPSSLPAAERVRPPHVSGTDTPFRPPIEEGMEKSRSIFWVEPSMSPSTFNETLDTPGKVDVYRVVGPAGLWVEINLDANGGAEDPNGSSPLDAVVEVFVAGTKAPVASYDDDWGQRENGDRDYYLDPPVFRQRIPFEGSFDIHVRPYAWPQEGAQSGLPLGDRSYSGPDYDYRLKIKALDQPCYDLTGDSRVNGEDLLEAFVEVAERRPVKRNKIDDPDLPSPPDLFSLAVLWNRLGDRCP